MRALAAMVWALLFGVVAFTALYVLAGLNVLASLGVAWAIATLFVVGLLGVLPA